MDSGLFNRVSETSTTVGTGTLTLAGAVAGWHSFGAKVTNGARVRYVAVLGAAFEYGLGTFTAPDQLERTEVIGGSDGTDHVDFPAGVKDVFCDAMADNLPYRLRVVLPAATARDLFNTPGVFIPAPGAGKMVRMRQTFSIMSGQTRPFGAHNIHAYYDGFTPNTGADPALNVTVIVGSGFDESVVGPVVWAPAAISFGDAANLLALPSTGNGEFSSYENRAVLLWAREEMGTAGLAASYTITAGGAGYQVGNTIDLSDGAVITVATVDGGGAVLTFTITTPGTAIVMVGESHSEDATSGGGDGNFTVEVATIAPGDGLVTIDVEYDIVTVP